VRFEQRLRDGIRDGSITVIFRRWRRCQVVAGGRYRTGIDMIEVDAVEAVDPASISSRDAKRAGYASADAARADLYGDPDVPTYRLAVHRLDEPDPRTVLAHTDKLSLDDITEIDHRLSRLDRASSHGPWTAATLAAIAARPDVRAPDLAASFGLETLIFKRDVRKLKALGLTLSQPVGYQLSPRGRTYVRTTSQSAPRAADGS
jgi:hypothetical protein